MNTPDPCCYCWNLYYDCLCEDDPSYIAECKENLELGNKKCPKFLANPSMLPYKEKKGEKMETIKWLLYVIIFELGLIIGVLIAYFRS